MFRMAVPHPFPHLSIGSHFLMEYLVRKGQSLIVGIYVCFLSGVKCFKVLLNKDADHTLVQNPLLTRDDDSHSLFCYFL